MNKYHNPSELEVHRISLASKTYRVRVDPAGRVVIPSKLRAGLEIQSGEELLIRAEDGGIRLETFSRAIDFARDLLSRSDALPQNQPGSDPGPEEIAGE
jgi:AbrB family looped-hinge helix DNA binding protein